MNKDGKLLFNTYFKVCLSMLKVFLTASYSHLFYEFCVKNSTCYFNNLILYRVKETVVKKVITPINMNIFIMKLKVNFYSEAAKRMFTKYIFKFKYILKTKLSSF